MKRVTIPLGIATALALGWGSDRRALEPRATEFADTEFHPANLEQLLRVNWGKPGFCTEYATDYDPKRGRCRSGGMPYRRKFISSE